MIIMVVVMVNFKALIFQCFSGYDNYGGGDGQF